MNGANLLVEMLRQYDVRKIFGVPGDTNVELYDALGRCRHTIEHVMARDERGAGFMADAYARVTNRPGVVEVPSGAGAMYALPAVAEAQGSSIPIILITSDTPLMGEGRGVITELDCAGLFQPVTKASVLIKSALKIPETVRRAFRVATTGRPGAVHIAVPEDVLHEEVDVKQVSLHGESACRRFPACPPNAAREDIVRLQRLICDARRPLLVAGGGVNSSGASQALTRYAERWSLPVVTTITGQNSIGDTHELSIGIIGDNGFHPHANRAMEEADLLVLIGCRNGSVASIGWTFPTPREERKVAQVDIDPSILGNNSRNELSIMGDARSVLEGLNDLQYDAPAAMDPDWVPRMNRWRGEFWNRMQERSGAGESKLPHPQTVIEELNRRLKATHYLFSDPGTATPYLCRFLRLNDEKSRLLIPRAYGGLGYAIPAVVGSWMARQDIRPIALFGDGSLGMAAGDLETIVRLNVPAILLNFNNSCFGWIKALQRLHGAERFLSVDFGKQDYSALGEAFGIRSIHVESTEELTHAFDTAFDYAGPILLDIVVESIDRELPPVFSWLRKSGADPMSIEAQHVTLGG